MSYQRAADCNVWILDVDDCLYHIDNTKTPGQPGLHQRVKDFIIENWNTHASLPIKEALGKHVAGLIPQIPEAASIDPLALKPQDLKIVFPHMLMAIKDVAPDSVLEWLDKFYGNLYEECLAVDPVLVEAFRTARRAGIRILLYTNGPSHPTPGQDSHVQKVLRALGLDEIEIDALRPETQDLIISEDEGFAKPHPQSMVNFIQRFGINPNEALMADDSTSNLVTAHKAGILPIWTWTSDTTPAAKDVLAMQGIALQVRNTAEALLQIARARLLQLTPAPAPSPNA